jgi:hypothetical protein
LLGIDLDNTVVCYDGLFHATAVEWGLAPAAAIETKEALRDRLRGEGQEERWTELQGYVYGPGMARAEPFPGVLEFLSDCVRGGVPVAIISHRTRQPYVGPPHDLHAHAREWLSRRGVTDPAMVGLAPSDVHLEETKQSKLRRIAACRCTRFIDDLPEFLTDPGFPAGVEPVVFDPEGSKATAWRGLQRLTSWHDARSWISQAAN